MIKKSKVFLITLCMILITVLCVPAAFGQQTIDVITNGGGGNGTGGGTGGGGGGGGTPSYSAGSVVVISGQVLNDGNPLANGNVSVQVQNSGNMVVFYTDTPTDSQGFYRTIFALPKSSFTGQYTVTVNSLAASGSTYFSVTSAGKEGPALMGWSPQGLSLSTPVETISQDTKQIVLVFSKNVNYFHNSNHPDFEIGVNENNEDSISIFKGESNKPVSFQMQLISSDAGSSSDISYYDINEKQISESEGKRAIILNLSEDLAANTAYKIIVSKDLCANNGIKLGQDIAVYFKTGEAAVIPPVIPPVTPPVVPPDTPPVNPPDNPPIIPPKRPGGGDDSPSISAQSAANVVNTEQKQIVTIIPEKVLGPLQEGNPLVIDLSTIESAGNQERIVNLAQQTIALAQQQNQNIILQDAGFFIGIPAGALNANQAFAVSIKPVENNNLPAVPGNISPANIFEFNAGENGQTGHHTFNQKVTIGFPVPQGIVNLERLCVYYLNETTGRWEYSGGRVKEGWLVFQTGHFSKYMVAESTKTFKDIEKHWAQNSIETMIARQVVSGVSGDEFAPERNITRAEFATLLCKALNLDTEGSDNSGFSDVAQTDWYAAYVAKAAKAGVISGYAGQFRPNAQINRQEMSTMVMRAYSYKNGKSDNTKEFTFVDKDTISPWAVEAVKGAYNLGIIKGRGEGQFAPLENATRGEATVMLKSFMDTLSL